MQEMLILSELNDTDLDWLASVGHKQTVVAGTTLITEGQAVDTLYVLLDGMLVVSISAMEGRQIARLSTGEVVGEMSFVDARPPSATVKTLEPSTVLAVPRSLLIEKLQQDQGFGSRFYRALAVLLSRRLRGTVQQLGHEVDVQKVEPESTEETVILPGKGDTETRFNRLLERLETHC